MTLPFCLKVGRITLEISPERITCNDSVSDDLWSEIPDSWRTVKDLVEIYIKDHESAQSLDPFHRNPKVKLMMAIFSALSNAPVEEKTFIKELLKTGRFSEEAKSYIIPAVIHGMFKQDGDGLYVRA